MKYFSKTLLFSLFIAVCAILSAGEMRPWTGSNGKIIEAEVLALEGDVVKIKLKSGREMSVLLSKFAEKDQEIIKQITSTEDPFGEDAPMADGELLPFTDFRNNRMPFTNFGKGEVHISDSKPFSFKAGNESRISNENGIFKIVCGKLSNTGSDTWGTSDSSN